MLAASRGVDGTAAPFETRVTTDGSAPSAEAPLYDQPLVAERVRAALFLDGASIVEVDSAVPKLRPWG